MGSASTPERSSAIDGARGLAALSVLLFHAWLYTRVDVSASARETTLDYALHEGRLGLVLFFVLSGFLLWRPFVAAARGRRPRPGTREYLVRRGARVLPAYYLALAGSLVLLWGASETPGVRLPPAELLPHFLVFAQNFNPATVMKLDPPMWTLAVEVSFYLLLPLLAPLALLLPRTRAVQALGAAGAARRRRAVERRHRRQRLDRLQQGAAGDAAVLRARDGRRARARRPPPVRAARRLPAAGGGRGARRRRRLVAGARRGRRDRTPTPSASGATCRARPASRSSSRSRPAAPARARRCCACGRWRGSGRSPTASTCGTCRCCCSRGTSACCRCTRCRRRSSRSC